MLCLMQFFYISICLGPRHRQRFLCEVRVDTISYVGAGNSTTKKEAQMNASRDFVNYLTRTGQVKHSEVPEDVAVKAENDGSGVQEPTHSSSKPVFQVIYNLI